MTDPVVEAAVEAYLGQPLNFPGKSEYAARVREHDAFLAGVQWAERNLCRE